jgi:UDP-N-acetylmuramate dehydrogenase
MLDIKNLPQVRGTYRQNAELKNWFGVEAKAEILFKPADIADLEHFLQNRSQEIPLIILGAASNVIIDGVVKGVVIRLGGEFAKISHSDEIVTVGAAALCGNVALHSKNAALAELEFFTGVPGSIGGALAMNAGCYGSDVSKTLIKATALDFAGKTHVFTNEDFEFFYRGSVLMKRAKKDFSGGIIFVNAEFKAVKSTFDEVAKKIFELNQQRENAQPIRAKTGGSTFKNPDASVTDKRAWQLIDEAGCREMSQGDAQISQKHCNFMINRGSASARDLIDLGDKVKNLVKQKTGVDLEWEIKVVK